MISAWVPLSIRTLVTSHLSMCVLMTMSSVCGKDMSLISALVRVKDI
jgi:hypothetical protein